MLDILFYDFDIKMVVGNYYLVVLYLVAFDIAVGLLVAGKERKINSSISFDGLTRKLGLFMALFFVTFIDAFIQANGNIIKFGMGALTIYEIMSIIENFSRLGINLDFITKYFEPKKVGRNDDDDEVEK